MVVANAVKSTTAPRNTTPTSLVLVPILSNDGYDTRLEKWENKHLLAYNAMLSCLGLNYYNDYKASSSNAYLLWIAIKEGCKPKGSGTLNNRYRQLLMLKLYDFKNTSKYAGKFKKLYNDIVNIYKYLGHSETYLIFLFYIGLGKEYKDYFLYYT